MFPEKIKIVQYAHHHRNQSIDGGCCFCFSFIDHPFLSFVFAVPYIIFLEPFPEPTIAPTPGPTPDPTPGLTREPTRGPTREPTVSPQCAVVYIGFAFVEF